MTLLPFFHLLFFYLCNTYLLHFRELAVPADGRTDVTLHYVRTGTVKPDREYATKKCTLYVMVVQQLFQPFL